MRGQVGAEKIIFENYSTRALKSKMNGPERVSHPPSRRIFDNWNVQPQLFYNFDLDLVHGLYFSMTILYADFSLFPWPKTSSQEHFSFSHHTVTPSSALSWFPGAETNNAPQIGQLKSVAFALIKSRNKDNTSSRYVKGTR